MRTEEEIRADEEWNCVACTLVELDQRLSPDGILLDVTLDVECPDGKTRPFTVAVLPVLFIKRSDRVHSFVWCPACKQEHAHGHGEGHRIAHCPPGSPFTKHGYLIRTPSE